MRHQDIAIIGMSGIFPGAETLDAFYKNLSQGVDSVGELTEERRSASCIAEREYQRWGYLSRIDLFDYKFFHLSKREAELMDPHLRFTLQLVYSAIENAGYSLQQMKGSQTAVLLGGPNSLKTPYHQRIKTFDPMIVSGNLYAMLAGRVAHFFDLHGPAMVIDTACSSSLLAVHEACEKLRSGEVDYALAGGVNLDFDFPLKDPGEERVGTESPDGKCKPFDASANGIVGGEGGGIVLLKPLARAMHDRDHIYASIKGGAVNQDGGRCAGITAPSPGAQKEVILRAWEKSGIDPETISYIEAHGTGTKLGDPIEIQGLTQAFQQYTQEQKFCAIGSLKSNIGHLACASGIASLIKMLLSFQYKELFPSLHYHVPNPYIDFEHTAIYVNTTHCAWEGRKGLRRGGISSFGLSGTNVHIVMEEAPEAPAHSAPEDREQLVTFSAKTFASLTRYLSAFADYLDKGPSVALEDIAYTLNLGRDDYLCRFSRVTRSKEALLVQIQAELAAKSGRTSVSERRVVFVFSHDATFTIQDIEELCAQFPSFREAYQEGRNIAHASTGMGNDSIQRFVFQWALYKLWISLGISSTKIVGYGVGNIVGRVITGKLSFQDGLYEAANLDTPKKVPSTRLHALVQKLSQSGHTLFLEMGGSGTLSRDLASLSDNADTPEVVISPSFGPQRSLLSVLSQLYCAGVTINWQKYYEGRSYKRLDLPGYSFEQDRCWVDVEIVNTQQETSSEAIPSVSLHLSDGQFTATEQKLAAFWSEMLKVDTLSIDSDFFDVGGNSLNGLRVLGRIEQAFGISLEFQDVYQYPTLRAFGQYIDLLSSERDAGISSRSMEDAGRITRQYGDPAVLSFAQQSLWFLHQFEENASYNIPLALCLRGKLDTTVLEKSLGEIVTRHETLRSIFPVQEGQPSLLVKAAEPFRLHVEDLSYLVGDQQDSTVQQRIRSESRRLFHLSEETPFRASLLRLGPDTVVLLVTMHHIVSDGWSINLFMKELAFYYEAFLCGKAASLPELPIRYRDYAAWQRKWLQGERREKLIAYWKNTLASAPLLLKLPLDQERTTVQKAGGSQSFFVIPAALTARLRELSRQEKVTLFMVLLTAWKAQLYLYSGQDDIVIGTPIAGRQVETENLIGLFVNTLVLRTRFAGKPTFHTLLQQIKNTTLEAYAHQGLPFHLLIDLLTVPRSAAYHPLFQVMFDLHNYEELSQKVTLSGIRWEFMDTETGATKFDLCMTLYEDRDEISGRLEYNLQLFHESTIQQIIADYLTLLERMVSHLHEQLVDLSLEERTGLQRAFTDDADAKDEFHF